MARKLAVLLACLAACVGVRGNSFTPPVQLHPCVANAPTQLWKQASNGSLYTMDVAGHAGYCLKFQLPAASPHPGTPVFAANCGGTSNSNNGGQVANTTVAELWAVKGSTLVSADPNASNLCFGATPPVSTTQVELSGHRYLQSNPQQGGGTGFLSNCSSPAAQFSIGASTVTPGTVVHKASGLCLTLGRCAAPPPAPGSTSPVSGTHPCDIYKSAGNECVAAHSMTRALFATYAGALYSVSRASDNATQNISVKTAGGFANAALQDTFCAGTWCIVDKIYDQTPNSNHLGIFGPNKGVNASQDRHIVGGHGVYSANFSEPGLGYRNINHTSANATCAGPGFCTGPGVGIAVGEEAESMYMVVSGKHFNSHCCFDYGNAEKNAHDNGDGTMEALCLLRTMYGTYYTHTIHIHS